MIFFLVFFFFSIRPTDPVSGKTNSTLNKKKGMVLWIKNKVSAKSTGKDHDQGENVDLV